MITVNQGLPEERRVEPRTEHYRVSPSRVEPIPLPEARTLTPEMTRLRQELAHLEQQLATPEVDTVRLAARLTDTLHDDKQ